MQNPSGENSKNNAAGGPSEQATTSRLREVTDRSRSPKEDVADRLPPEKMPEEINELTGRLGDWIRENSSTITLCAIAGAIGFFLGRSSKQGLSS